MIKRSTTWEEFISNPNKFGVPTLEQFAKNKAHFQKMFSVEEDLAIIDAGPNQVRRQIGKIKFYVKGHFCRSLEKAQKVAESENIDLRYFHPELVDIGGHRCDIHVHFDTERKPKSALILPPS